jgi:hypothetical protein
MNTNQDLKISEIARLELEIEKLKNAISQAKVLGREGQEDRLRASLHNTRLDLAFWVAA